MNTPRIIVADDHTLFADALGHLLQDSYPVVATFPDGRTLLEKASELRPDLVILDIGMPLLNGIDAARRLKRILPRVKIVFLSMHCDVSYVTQALLAGGSGYVLKTSSAAEIQHAIRSVLAGEIYLDSQLSEDVRALIPRRIDRDPPIRPVQLTAREREVLQLVAEGYPAKEIAFQLHVSPKTIEFHKYNMMRKNMLHTTAGLVRLAFRLGISNSDQPLEKQGDFPVKPARHRA